MYHRFYGCDTGCCGHAVAIFDDEWTLRQDFDPYFDADTDRFDFDHPPFEASEAAKIAWAREFVRRELGEEHVADLDWDHCILSDD